MLLRYSFTISLLWACLHAPAQNHNWTSVGGDPGATRHSSLSQIHRDNVASLRVAWTWRTGEPPQTLECTPLVIDGVMFVTTGQRRVAALNAATGKALWIFDPLELGPPAGPYASGGVNRGVAYWSDGQPDGPRRILHGTADGRLFSLDAATGKPDKQFGKGGYILLRDGIEYDISRLPYGPTSAPAVFDNLVLVGFSNSEGHPPGAPGDIRAFDIRSGKQTWRFHTIPRPGEFGHDTWPEDGWQQRSGANAWGGFSVDGKRGLVFAGLGSAAADFYGGDRHGQNLFANCVIALDARTGKRQWHFQTTHHDLWDHDLPVYPNLVTVTHGGRAIDAVAQVTKTGYVFLFDRVTGKPLFDIEEVPVPASDVPGEQAWPTQPVPVKPPSFVKQSFLEEDITDVTPEAKAHVTREFKKIRGGSGNNPPSVEGTIVIPGLHGGATWAGASFDPETGWLFVNGNNDPWLATLTPQPGNDRQPYRTSVRRFTDQDGHPAIKPPWGNLTAIDLNKGEFAWQIVLGEYPDLKAKGVAQTGTETFGGTIVTAGGLVFIGGTKDEKFHAFDKTTGKLLWEIKLPAGGYATPCTYSVHGKQYISIAAGGAGKQGTQAGDTFVTFALP